MNNTKRITIDVDLMLETALKGARRAYVFCCLGTNAARDSRLTQYWLEFPTVQLLQRDLPKEQIDHFKKEFGKWITHNALRELVETFAVYLDNVFYAALVVMGNRIDLDSELQRKLDQFERFGLEDKLTTLDHEFSITPRHPKFWVSHQRARNCITHRRGTLGNRDVQEDGRLVLNWPSFEAGLKYKSGEKISFEDHFEAGNPPLKDHATPYIKVIERELVTEKGQPFSIPPERLVDMTQLLISDARAVANSWHEFATRNGASTLNMPSTRDG